jgi:hypothetical protein
MPNETLRPLALALAGAMALAVLGACAVSPPAVAPPPPQVSETTRNSPSPAGRPGSADVAPMPPPATSVATPVPAAPSTQAAAAAGQPEGDAEAGAGLLRYADRVRALTPPELALEVAALGDPGGHPSRQLQLAMALMQLNQPVETARALGLAQRVAANAAPEAAPYRPLARLIAGRLMEQRKLEEAMERQSQQLRDQQRRIEQLTERLEAMRAIERSLNNRAPAAAPRTPTTP